MVGYTLDQMNNYLNGFSRRGEQLINEYGLFINRQDLTKFIRKKKKIREAYIEQWDKKFNIFKISYPNDFHYETFHSRLIASLLDLNTSEMESAKNLKILIKLCRIIEPDKIKDYKFLKDYKVIIEKGVENGRVDILIHDENMAIIIENKSNNARDTDNQLAKYYKYVEDMRLNGGESSILAVVYLPLDPNKIPDLKFDGEFKDKGYEEKINNVLVKLPVMKDNKKDFVHGFLEECHKNLRCKCNKTTAKIYIKQLINMFKYLGGDNMILGINKELFKKLFQTDVSISMTKDIVDIYNNRSKILKLILSDSIIKKLQVELNFITEGAQLLLKIQENNDIYLSFYFGTDVDYFAFGFYSKEKYEEQYKNKLIDLLKEYKECFIEDITHQQQWIGGNWIVKSVDLLYKGDMTFDDAKKHFENLLLESYKSLFVKAKKL